MVLEENKAKALSSTFTAYGTVKDDPDQKIVSEVFKAMDLAGGGEERVAGRKFEAPAFAGKPATAGNHDIKLITGVRLLEINAFGRVDLDRQCAVAEKLGVQFAVARGDGILGVGKFEEARWREVHKGSRVTVRRVAAGFFKGSKATLLLRAQTQHWARHTHDRQAHGVVLRLSGPAMNQNTFRLAPISRHSG